jgi:hypothetical protein
MLASEIVSETYRLLRRPSQDALPYRDVLKTANDVIRGRLVDMKMAARNHTPEVGSWVVPSGRTMNAAGFTGGRSFVLPVSMEWRYQSQDDAAVPQRVELVSYEMLNDLWRSSFTEVYAAFYRSNGQSMVAFSDAADYVSDREYRLVYETLSDTVIDDTTTQIDLPDLFEPLCSVETAIKSLDYVHNDTEDWAMARERLRSSLTTDFLQWNERFKQWQNTLYGNKLVTKGGFRPRRGSISF